MEARIARRRIAIAIGGAVAVCSAGTAIAVADGADRAGGAPAAAHATAAYRTELAAWARANGMTGLSPAALTATQIPSTPADQSALAAWAGANGLSGLSPASLDRIDD